MQRSWWRHDVVVLVLGVLSVGLVMWYDGAGLNAAQRQVILVLDAVLVGYFVLDWVLMWHERAWQRRWALVNSWRLLGMVPLYFAGFSFLRLLRLARIVSVLEKLPPIRAGIRSLKRQLDFRALAPLAVAATTITLVGALLVWLAERRANPDLFQFGEALWWAIVTVTTVGYGDITPVTRIGRLVAVLLMVTGIGTIGMLASQVSAALIRGEEREIAGEAVPPATGVAGQLAELATLYQQGALDEAEFRTAKARVLDGRHG